MEIKNIIFDLGGVLLNLDYSATVKAFENLGIKNIETLYSQVHQTELFDKFEKGLITDNEFLDKLQTYFPKEVTQEMIIDAWNAMLLNFPERRFEFLLQVKQNYKTALLSNTNTIHLDSFFRRLREEHQQESLTPFFHGVYYSCAMKMRKPDSEIFLKVCEKEGFLPAETLFIDDSEQHVLGARKIGLKAYHLDINEETIEEYFRREKLI